MNISVVTLVIIIGISSFITYIIFKYTQSCDIKCNIQYNKTENFSDEPVKDYYKSNYAVHLKKNQKPIENPFMRNIENDIKIKNDSISESSDSYIENLLWG